MEFPTSHKLCFTPLLRLCKGFSGESELIFERSELTLSEGDGCTGLCICTRAIGFDVFSICADRTAILKSFVFLATFSENVAQVLRCLPVRVRNQEEEPEQKQTKRTKGFSVGDWVVRQERRCINDSIACQVDGAGFRCLFSSFPSFASVSIPLDRIPNVFDCGSATLSHLRSKSPDL
jgi:hypothetical protein